MNSQVLWTLGLIASISGALINQTGLFNQELHGYITIIFITTTAISGYMLEKPRKIWTEEERERKLNEPK